VLTTDRRHPTLLLMLVAALGGCSDDEHKGTISTGSAAPTSSALVEERVLLVYSPGTPIATMRTAKRFKRRLAKAGLKDVKVGIGGEVVHVEPKPGDVDATKKALSGGRLDVHVFSDTTNPFANVAAEDVAPLSLGTETVTADGGSKTLHFLTSDASQRQALKKAAEDKSLGALTLVGPIYEGGKATGLRTYYADPERKIRGEMVAAAKAEGDELAISFEGNGKSFLRWQGKQKSRLLLRVDGDVIATVQLTEPIKDGVLHVSGLPQEQVTAIADDVDGTAVSHECVLKEEE